MKRLIAALIVTACLCGCKSENKIQVINTSDAGKQIVGDGFNGEDYVWESWSFSTNRVEGVK